MISELVGIYNKLHGYPTIFKWVDDSRFSSYGQAENGAHLVSITLAGPHPNTKYRIIICDGLLSNLDISNNLFESIELAKQAVEAEIITKNRKRKIGNILKDLNGTV